jgi:multiple sugar transport system permease protein
MSWRAQRARGKWLRAFLLVLAGVIFLAPVLWTLAASLGVMPDNSHAPPSWFASPSLEHYAEIGALTPTFAQALETGTWVAAAATGLTIVVAYLAAYALAGARFRRRWFVVQGFLILASVPVMAYALPLLSIVRTARLYDTFVGVVAANSAGFAPLAAYILYGYLAQVPPELEQAARLEGATLWQILWRVVVPLTVSGVAATAVIVFVLNWNLLLVPMILSETQIKTIPILMTDFFRLEREIDWQSAAAVLTVSLAPLLALLAVTHRLLDHFTLTAVQSIE